MIETPATVRIDTPEAGRLMRLATYASVAAALVLIVAKTGAWLATDSIALLSSLVDSLLDVIASLVTLVAVRHALSPADREHRFGHGKAEALAALSQSAFVVGSAVLLLFEAGKRLLQPKPVEESDIGIAVMVFSIVVTLALVTLQKWVVKRSGSVAIAADSLHYKGDLLVNIAVIVALVLSTNFGWILADPLFGVAITGYIIYNAWLILKSSLDMLMDRELSDEDRQRIRDIAVAHDAVEEVHDLRTRRSGQTCFIQFHLELDGDMRLMQAHEIADAVELAVRKAFPGAEVIIHQDPAGLDEGHEQFA
ncbi:MAG: cation diffusion facilitator family transporter [Alphaproteobacteria bacterium]|jgi:ferrous-iron efflux pump FieF|nr:cation diffusion facilitator family transporter [Alphaproteobacteria bacterium]